jgi:hypothetical protein
MRIYNHYNGKTVRVGKYTQWPVECFVSTIRGFSKLFQWHGVTGQNVSK